MKAALSTTILLGSLFIAPAHAGWLDALTGGDSTEKATTEAVAETTATSGDLVSTVMSQLGLTQTQAEGGLGSLLSVAQSNLDADSFSSISESIPNIDTLLEAVPTTDSSESSGMSNLLSKAGDLSSSLEAGSSIYSAFESLGISSDLISPMISTLSSYLSTSGTEGSSDLLMQGLKALL